MNQIETSAHHLLARLKYLLARLEGEFFHLQPDLNANGDATSLALCSILNEAANIQEAAFDGDFLPTLKAWGLQQTWDWNSVEVRFTWWPVCEVIQPFSQNADGVLTVAGRAANNEVKHQGKLANLRNTIGATAATWFLVMERVREAGVFLAGHDHERLFALFDCFDLLDTRVTSYGEAIGRPLSNRVEYPRVRGASEIDLANDAYKRRLGYPND